MLREAMLANEFGSFDCGYQHPPRHQGLLRQSRKVGALPYDIEKRNREYPNRW